MNVANKPQMMNNNLMTGAPSQRSGGPDGSEVASEQARQPGGIIMRPEGQNLANIANSVSGFYKDHGPEMSEHSNMSRTQDMFASNLIGQRANKHEQSAPGGGERIYGTG